MTDDLAALAMVGDVGGTNCRFGLARAGHLIRESLQSFAVTEFPRFADAAAAYLQKQRITATSACIAIAGPITGDWVQLTNQQWGFSIAQARSELQLARLSIINDFEAVGLALAHLRAEQLQKIGGGDSLTGKPKVALGPGTGYGAVHVIEDRHRSVALPTESGHISLAPSTRAELELFEWLLDRNLQITCEQLLSGPGLQTLYRALSELRGKPAAPLSAAEIQVHAVAGSDPICVDALNMFCELLGTAARDQALCCLAQGGIFIAGGIVQRFVPFLRASGFRRRFEDSATMRALLEPIPTYVIVDDNPGLIGAAVNTAAY